MSYYSNSRNNKSKKRYTGIRELSHVINDVTKPVLRKRGFAENKILTDWSLIVGDRLNKYSSPKKLSFPRDKKADGTLHVEVYDSGIAMELEYMKNIVLEKIAQYFGYKAVAKIKIIQNLDNRFISRAGDKVELYKEPEVPESKKQDLENLISDISDDELRWALSSLGAKVYADND